jgi:hypothetical protein
MTFESTFILIIILFVTVTFPLIIAISFLQDIWKLLKDKE